MVSGRAQPQFLGGEVAYGPPVHSVVDGACARHHLHSLPLVVEQALGAYGFNLRHNDVGLVSGHGSVEGVAVEHAEHIALIGHLHGRGAGIAVASHDILPCPLGCNDELTAQFA